MASLDIVFHRIATEVLEISNILPYNMVSFVRIMINSCLGVCNRKGHYLQINSTPYVGSADIRAQMYPESTGTR